MVPPMPPLRVVTPGTLRSTSATFWLLPALRFRQESMTVIDWPIAGKRLRGAIGGDDDGGISGRRRR
jgi:hypothetical protein